MKFTQKNNSFPTKTKHKAWYFIWPFLASFFLCSLIFGLSFFCPDFLFSKIDSFSNYLSTWIFEKHPNYSPCFYLFWIIKGLLGLFSIFFVGLMIRQLTCAWNYKKWYFSFAREQAKIINSCDSKKFNDKVALIVCICDDFMPKTLLQTANQTYKNIDVWICDDSKNEKNRELIDSFAKEHGFFVMRRDSEHKKMHKSKIGNIDYWLERYGKGYDYIFENDSSSIVTSTFVEHCLCYHHSELLKDIKIGGIICNGTFYSTKNLLTDIYSKSFQVGLSLTYQSWLLPFNKVLTLNGWCTFYKIEDIAKIPLEEVECSVCDSLRGMWLIKHGYSNLYNPFDFGGKIAVQNIRALKNQRMKWTSGDYFTYKSTLNSKYCNSLETFATKTYIYSLSIIVLLVFLLGLSDVILTLALNIFYVNWTTMLFSSLFTIITFFVFCIFCFINNYPLFKVLWYVILSGILFTAISYKLLWQMIVRGFIMHTTSVLTCVTRKDIYSTTIKEKMRMCLFDLLVVLFGIGLCLTLTFTLGSGNSNPSNSVFESTGLLNNWSIWLILFPFISMPSILYIFMVWIGEIKVKRGYDPNQKTFAIEKEDFRYNWVEEIKSEFLNK